MLGMHIILVCKCQYSSNCNPVNTNKEVQHNMASTPLASNKVIYKDCMKMTEYNLSYTTLMVERAFNWTIQRK